MKTFWTPAIATRALVSGAIMAGATASFAGDVTLPAPFVSRALDAVLMPINADVQGAFNLAADETGVLVVAVDAGGVAASYGIEPGDVISSVKGHKIVNPIDVDTVVYYWIEKGAFDFVFDTFRAGVAQTANSTITLEQYTAVIEISSVETWSSYSSESYSYSEYYAEYSSEMTSTYESSETTIEETATSEEFSSEVTTEATSEETSTEATTEETTTEATDEAATDEAATDEVAADGSDEAAADAADEGAADDGTADDAGTDDGGDAGGDDGGDAGGDDGGDGEVVE